MIKDYTYIKQQIARSKGTFQLDCCKLSTELFWLKYKKQEKSHKIYETLLCLIADKLNVTPDV